MFKIKPLMIFANVIINLSAFILYGACLWLISHNSQWFLVLPAVILFSYVGNTLFGFLHECVHRVYAPQKWLNETAGIINAAAFPTGLTFQRICHLGHHLRNRTDYEMFDMYYPDDNKFLKFAQFYSILLGIYWITIPLGWLGYLLLPWSYRLLKTDNKAIQRTGAIMLHPFINHPKKNRIRLELIFTLIFQYSLFQFLDLSFWPTFGTFWFFGMVWGSLQYADHAWSVRDISKGAWNLKVNPITRFFFLNYHYHQVHHTHPKMPWYLLPQHADPKSPQPSFWKIYVQMWKGPRPANAPAPQVVLEAQSEIMNDEDMQNNAATSSTSQIISLELLCLKQMYYFSKRNLRYLKAALLLYVFSLRKPRTAKLLRHGFCALQLLDDYLDGDRACAGEPLEKAQQLKQALLSNTYDSSDLQRLMQAFVSQFSALPQAAEMRQELINVIEAMCFDRQRVLKQLILSKEELRRQHHRTFSASLNLVLLSLGSNLRVSDVAEILDLFAWCSTIRDLSEDLSKGLINIPSEIAEQTDLKQNYASLSATPAIQHWLASEKNQALELVVRAQEKIERLPKENGVLIFKIFVKSMHRYALKQAYAF